MNELNYNEKKKYFNFLNSLAKKLTRIYFKKLQGSFKVDNKLKKKGKYDPVTNIDRAFEKFIRNEINKKFPSHQIIGEEFSNKKTKSDFSWIIDPIDGTRSFVIGNPTWSNLISLNYKSKPIFGLANFPVLKKYYISGIKNSYLIENNKRKKIKVNSKQKIKLMKVAGGFHGYISLKNQLKIPKILKLMNFPCSDALSYCHLAEGRLDVVLQCANKIWDIHPLIPIIKNAGGKINTWKKDDPSKAGNILVSSNIKIHNYILKLLKPVSKI